MTEEKIKLMEQWYTTMVLMGHDMDSIYDDWNGSDTIYTLLELEEQRQRRLADPDDQVKAFLLTLEMGIATTDIDEFQQYREEQEDLRIKAEREERERNNPKIKALIEDHAFTWIKSKQYPKHKHFTFVDKNGIPVTGRLFNPSWGHVRIWLTWKEPKGKRQFRWDAKIVDMIVPKAFPHEWQEWGHTSNLDRIAQIVAHWVVEKCMPKQAGFVYPKK
jgi:hypothetical protein